jgi:predicted DNA-binding transcriptional regulator AlpA
MSTSQNETTRAIEPLLYRLGNLPAVLNVSLETIGRMRSKGRFPRPDLVLGSRIPVWRRSTIENWINEQAARKGDRR